MADERLRALLRRLDRPSFGVGEPSGEVPDDRRGHYWLVTDDQVRLAVKVALITGRPLLVEGPSGSGKSALARAVSESLGWTYYETVVTSQTRIDELTGWVDLIRRLHQAEVAGRTGMEFLDDLGAFVSPGVLWWALDPRSAADAGQGSHADPGTRARRPADESAGGAVVLVDEIDKAEPDLPNNLLVPLGSWELRIEGRVEPVSLQRPHRPLVLVTSNQERDMPPAFLRRCVVLRLGLPDPDQLIEIAHHHVGSGREVCELVRDRLVPNDDHRVSPAEFVDAVRAAVGLGLDATSPADLWADVETAVLGTGPGPE